MSAPLRTGGRGAFDFRERTFDTYEEGEKVYVRIIDYKSGNTSFSLLNVYHGLQLQLVVYMNAAMELVAKKHPDKMVEPAGIFYYHVKHPMVDGTGTESEAGSGYRARW